MKWQPSYDLSSSGSKLNPLWQYLAALVRWSDTSSWGIFNPAFQIS